MVAVRPTAYQSKGLTRDNRISAGLSDFAVLYGCALLSLCAEKAGQGLDGLIQ